MIQTVNIERMSYGPDGIAHLDSGKTVFVSGAGLGVVPGDIARIEIDSEHKRFDRAHVIELVEASTARSGVAATAISPWAAMDYEEQLNQKRSSVENALVRTGHLDAEVLALAIEPIVPSPDQWGYRNKIELMPTTGDRGKLALGFVGSSVGDEDGDPGDDSLPVIVPIKSCPLANNLIEQAPFALSGALRFVASRNGDLGIHRVGIRGSVRTNKVEVALWTSPGAFPRSAVAKVIEDATNASSIVRVISDGTASREVKKVEVLLGDGCWKERLAGCSFKVSAPSFFQVNTAQAETLVKLVIDAVSEFNEDAFASGGDSGKKLRIADVYSGVGTFSIPLAKAFPNADISAIELAGSSSRDFERNCRAAGIDIDLICDDAARALPSLASQDVMIVDPPRAGLSDKVVSAIVDSKPGMIAYVSCDPQTLARDMRKLLDAGYVLEKVAPVDMFPQTYHVETVAILKI